MKIGEWFTEKRVIYILSALLGITTILDLYTAFSSPIFHIAETNPLFLLWGIWPLTLLNFIWMIVIIRGLKKSIKILYLFAFVMACLLMSYGHIIGAQSNVRATQLYLDNPEKIIEQIHKITPEQKIQSYNDLVVNRIFIPYVISLIGFIIIVYFYEKRKPIRDKYIEEGFKIMKKGIEFQ